MTLTNEKRLIRHEGNGATTNFPYDFLIPDANSVIVSLWDEATDTTTVLNASQYNITGLGDPNFGEVTYPLSGSPIAAGTWLVIEREVAYTQDLLIKNQGGFFADSTMAQLDRIVMQTQQLAEMLERTPKFSPGSGVSNRRITQGDEGTTLIWDADGNIVEGPSTTEIESAQTYATEAKAARDAAQDAAERAETAAAGVEYPVSYAPQNLNPSQQAQARANLGLDSAATFATRAALKAAATAPGRIAYLHEEGREGKFRWRVGDYTTQVAADPLEGLYIAADSDPTGATGAWVRVLKDRTVYPEYWGAVSDAVRGDDGATTAASTTFTSASASFTSDDVGKVIVIAKRDADQPSLYTTIAAVTNGTTVVLSDPAESTLTDAIYVYGTDATDAWKAAISSGYHINGKKNARYLVTGPLGSVEEGVFIHFHGATIYAAWEQSTYIDGAEYHYEAVFFQNGQNRNRFCCGEIEYFGTFDYGSSYGGLVSGIHANDADYLTIVEMEIHGFNRCGVMVGAVADGSATPVCHRPVVRECNLHHNRVAGLAYGNTLDGSVLDNELTFNGHESDDGTGYGFTGWNAYNPVNTTVTGNHANNNWRKGIDFHSGHDGTIANNFCSGNRSRGIFVVGTRLTGTWVISNNQITDMEWDSDFPAGYLVGIELGSYVGQGMEEIPTSFIVTANTIRDFNVISGSGWGILLHGAGLSYGKFTIQANIIELDKAEVIIGTSATASNPGNYYDILCCDNQCRATETSSIPFYFRSSLTRKFAFNGNLVEVGTANTGGICPIDLQTQTVPGATASFCNNDITIPEAAWASTNDPFRIRRNSKEIMLGNKVNGAPWRDWTGYNYVGRGTGISPSSGNWFVGDEWIRVPTPSTGKQGSICVTSGTPGTWAEKPALLT